MPSARPRISRVLSLSALTLVSSFSAVSGLACSPNKSTGSFGTGGDSTSGPTEATTGTSNGGAGGGGGEGGSILVGSSGSSGTGGEVACAEATAAAKQIPLNIFVAVDQSGSMISDNKWENAKSAFTQFFLEPSAAEIGVALRFWPDPYDFLSPSPSIACNDAVDVTCGPAIVA
ncbi:MAG: hypothetical protein ABI134_24310, partial [Byssovorax sp.]